MSIRARTTRSGRRVLPAAHEPPPTTSFLSNSSSQLSFHLPLADRVLPFLHRRLHIDLVLSYFCQLFIGHFFFFESFLKNTGYIIKTKLTCVGNGGSVRGNLVMFHFLSCTDHACFHGAEFCAGGHYFLALLDYAFHANAFFTFW